MSNDWIFVVGLLVVLAIVCGLYMRRERQVMRLMAGVADQLGSLRSEMVTAGTAERTARLPSPPKRAGAGAKSAPSPVPRLPSVERSVVSVTRDDDPVHTRATVAGWPAPTNDREQNQPGSVAGTAALDHRAASASPKSETTGQMRARQETQEDEREGVRRRGEVEELPKLSADRSSDAETKVFSAARVTFRLAAAVVGEDDSEHVTLPRRPSPPPAPMPVVPKGDADSWDDTDELTHVRPHEPRVADTHASGGPAALRPAGSTTRRPPLTPPRRSTVVDGARAGGSQRPPPGAGRAPLPPLAATLSRARVDDDERPAKPKLAADIAYQFSLRIGRTAQSGRNVSHCGGADCNNDPAGGCACACDRCRSRRQVLAHVRLEMIGPTPAQRHAARVRQAQLVAELHQKGNRVGHCNRAECCPVPRERPSEVDTRLVEETCVCSCAGCLDMRALLKRAFGQIAEAEVT